MGSLGRTLLSKTRGRISPSVTSVSSSNPFSFFSRKPNSVVHGLWKVWVNDVKPTEQFYIKRLQPKFAMGRKEILCNFNSSRISMCGRSFTGIAAVAGTVAMWPADVFAMDGRDILVEHHIESGEPSGFLKKDLYKFWTLAKGFQLPAVLLLMVILGWRHPITLVINVILLLSCTRPSPYSVYIFIEQLRKQAMQHDPGLSKSKLFYARKVDVEDYKLLCTAKVELRDRKLTLIGILGSWWILQCSKI